MPFNIFITGGSGTVGREILRQLSQVENLDKRVGFIKAQTKDKQGAEKIALTNPAVQAVIFDFNNYESAVNSFKNVDNLVLITSYTVDMLIHGGKLIEAAVEAGVSYIIHLGVLQFDNRINYVNWMYWHKELENMIENYVRMGKSLKGFMHLRPYWFAENLLNYADVNTLDKEKQVIRMPFDPQTNIAWTVAEDIARVAVQILLHPMKYQDKIFPLVSEIDNLQHIVEIIREETTLKECKLETPSTQEFYEQVVQAGNDPVYMKGTKIAIETVNNKKFDLDAKKDPIAAEGMQFVELVTGAPPTSIRAWVKKRIQ